MNLYLAKLTETGLEGHVDSMSNHWLAVWTPLQMAFKPTRRLWMYIAREFWTLWNFSML